MKKFISLTLVVILLISGLFVLTACGEKSDGKDNKKSDSSSKVDLSDVAGTYVGQYGKFVGDPDSEKNEDEEFSLELNADGTGKHNRDGYSYNVTWSLKGEKFEMSETFLGDPIEYTGTLKDNKLDIFNGDPDDDWSYEYVYEKE